MTVNERALNFVMRAFHNNVDEVIHSLLVGMILKSYGYNDTTVAAGYLVDIPNKSNYSISDISRLFSGKVSSLVMTALNVDKSLDWKNKKNQTIRAISDLPESNMAVIIANYIIFLEQLVIDFKKEGKADFERFEISKEELESFYRLVYKKASRIIGRDLLDRFDNAIENVFENTYYPKYNTEIDDLYIKTEGYQEQLVKLKEVISDKKPYIIEFVGAEKTGKSSIMKCFKDFFENSDFRIKVYENDNETKYKNLMRPASVSLVERNLLISSAIKDNLMKDIIGDQDIIMVESGLYDALVMLKIYLDRNVITKNEYNDYMNKYLPDLEFIINQVVVCYTKQDEMMSRMSLDGLTVNNFYSKMALVDEYNEALENLDILINNKMVLDTTKLNNQEATLRLADTLFPIMTNNYVLKLKKMISDRD